MLFLWQTNMKKWEINLDNNLFEIMEKTKLSEERLRHVIDVLKEHDVIGTEGEH